VAEVVASKGCHSQHRVGQKIVFDSSGNLLTNESPQRVCAFLLPNLVVLINAFFENLMNGRDPNEIMFNRTGCFDVGPACGGWGHVVVEMNAEAKAKMTCQKIKYTFHRKRQSRLTAKIEYAIKRCHQGYSGGFENFMPSLSGVFYCFLKSLPYCWFLKGPPQ
jgi:hypothetical protein